jgi:HK97 gp10 family phage protein
MPSIGGDKTSARISLSGLPELDAKFKKMGVKIRKSIGTKALRQATNVTLRYARQYVLKDTKALSKGLKTSKADLGKEARLAGNFGMKVGIPSKKRAQLHYSVYIEFDPRMGGGSPLRFMKRAIIASTPEAKRIFETKLQSLIKSEEDKAVPSG